MTTPLDIQIGWVRAKAVQHRRLAARYAGQPLRRAQAERQLALAEATLATLETLRTAPQKPRRHHA